MLPAQHHCNKSLSHPSVPLLLVPANYLQDNCGKFVSNMQQLQDSVAKYVAAIDQQVSPRGWQVSSGYTA
jgi:hypothetical protein